MLPQHPINIGETAIAQDINGRFSLNDLHRAAGAEPRHQPAQFLRLDSIAELAREIGEKSDMGNPISVVRGGPGQGTFACRELVYAYAMWISAKFHLQVIRTFDALITGAAPAPTVRANPAKVPLMVAAGMAPTLVRALKSFGIDQNAATISANQMIRAETGVNLLQLAGHTHLVTPTQEICFTPTELGHRRCISAKTFNRSLADAGLQENIGGHWVPTAKGKPHAVVLDTGKAHSNGTPVQQVKWLETVLDEVHS